MNKKIMDEAALRRAVMRISHEIIEKNNGIENVCLVGIRRRGVPLAKSIAENIEKIENVNASGTKKASLTLTKDCDRNFHGTKRIV